MPSFDKLFEWSYDELKLPWDEFEATGTGYI